MARVNADPKYKSCRNRSGLKQTVEVLLNVSGVDLNNGRCLRNLNNLKIIFHNTKLLCMMV